MGYSDEEISIDTSEIEALAYAFEGLPLVIQDKVVLGATYAGAEVLQEAMMRMAPEQIPAEMAPHSDALKPGWLRADIRIVRLRTGSKRGWLIGSGVTTAYVTRWLEYGHRMVRGGAWFTSWKRKTRGKGKLAKGTQFVPAHPFIRPAWDSSISGAIEAAYAKARELAPEALREFVKKANRHA